jgi:uncharacterized protein YggL (DUF469 family)
VNRRLRKKKRVGEFRELGFEVTYRVPDDWSAERREEFLWQFLEHAIEANDLEAGGGGSNPLNFFVVSAQSRGSATNGQREAVKGWLSQQSVVTLTEVGPLRDAWYGWEE